MDPWIARYKAESGRDGATGYDAWAKDVSGAPSAYTLRRKYGSWNAAKDGTRQQNTHLKALIDEWITVRPYEYTIRQFVSWASQNYPNQKVSLAATQMAIPPGVSWVQMRAFRRSLQAA